MLSEEFKSRIDITTDLEALGNERKVMMRIMGETDNPYVRDEMTRKIVYIEEKISTVSAKRKRNWASY